MGELFITAFGPFGKFKKNPSEELLNAIEGCSRCVIPVSFAEVDSFLQNNPPQRFDWLLMLGVAAKAETFRIEKVARNEVGKAADNDNVVRGPGKIDSAGKNLKGSLFKGWRANKHWTVSTDAGAYLCNYLYYEATRRLPNVATGFVHVPPFDVIQFEKQLQILDRIIARLERPLTKT